MSILILEDLYCKSIEAFGEKFLSRNDPTNPIIGSWLFLKKAYDSINDKDQIVIIPQAKYLISAINLLENFKNLKVIDYQLSPVKSSVEINEFYAKTINELKNKKQFHSTINYLLLPSVLINSPLDFFPILESPNQLTPDYLVHYKNQNVLIECKNSYFTELGQKHIQRKTESLIRKAKKQLNSYAGIPGICQFATNLSILFENPQSLIDVVRNKIDKDTGNLSTILFTYFNDSDYPKYKVKYLPLFNFRAETLLPYGFSKDIFPKSGILVISSRVGDKHFFKEIEYKSNYYGIDPNLDECFKKNDRKI